MGSPLKCPAVLANGAHKGIDVIPGRQGVGDRVGVLFPKVRPVVLRLKSYTTGKTGGNTSKKLK
jgi:hypothetical protein